MRFWTAAALALLFASPLWAQRAPSGGGGERSARPHDQLQSGAERDLRAALAECAKLGKALTELEAACKDAVALAAVFEAAQKIDSRLDAFAEGFNRDLAALEQVLAAGNLEAEIDEFARLMRDVEALARLADGEAARQASARRAAVNARRKARPHDDLRPELAEAGDTLRALWKTLAAACDGAADAAKSRPVSTRAWSRTAKARGRLRAAWKSWEEDWARLDEALARELFEDELDELDQALDELGEAAQDLDEINAMAIALQQASEEMETTLEELDNLTDEWDGAIGDDDDGYDEDADEGELGRLAEALEKEAEDCDDLCEDLDDLSDEWDGEIGDDNDDFGGMDGDENDSGTAEAGGGDEGGDSGGADEGMDGAEEGGHDDGGGAEGGHGDGEGADDGDE